MPPLQGFSDNQFRTKHDLVAAADALLQPLAPYFSDGNAGIKIPIHSGAHFDDVAAKLEGYARPLWVVAALFADPDSAATRQDLLKPWTDGLRNGVNPAHPEYWGDVGDWDQRMVEAEIISYSLLTAPDAFYAPLPAESKEHLATWLMGLNGKVMPENNWRWFRVLSNLALIKVCDAPRESVWEFMEKDLETLESFYISEGWSSDGVWRPAARNDEEEGTGASAARGRHADYYSGSFALQFSQMLYSKFAKDLDPIRASLFKDRARGFIRQFWAYFDQDGAAIPFGRSLTYRFAMGAIYAAFAYCGLCVDSDELLSHGAVKGMLLRHLRWWAAHSENMFWPDGTLSIGYLYPNMYMCEDYNSPQSPYWALKSLILVALPPDHSFWMSEELAHPLAPSGHKSLGVQLVRPPRQILCNHPDGQHHFLLSSGQFCVWPMKAAAAKYGKFAYSSAFGLSVPTGNSLLAQIAPDNTLALSKDQAESWAVRWKSAGETEFVDLQVNGPQTTVATALVSRWKPWEHASVEVETTLIPPCHQWPDWHMRIHRIRHTEGGESISLTTIEGGFAIDGHRKSDGRILPTTRLEQLGETLSRLDSGDGEAAIEKPFSSLVISSAGASGVMDLSPPGQLSSLDSSGEILKPDPNTNLMATRTLIPMIRRHSAYWPTREVVLATGVFALSANHGSDASQRVADLEARWARSPKVTWSEDGQLILG